MGHEEYVVLDNVKLWAVKPDSAYDQEQLLIGTYVELEHTPSKKIAKMIAKHHLDENLNYYKRGFIKNLTKDINKYKKKLKKEGKI